MVSMPHAALLVVQAADDHIYNAFFEVSMPHAALLVVQDSYSCSIVMSSLSFNAARGFVGGARLKPTCTSSCVGSFIAARGFVGGARVLPIVVSDFTARFNAARGFVGGARMIYQDIASKRMNVSMPHAALLVVQERAFRIYKRRFQFQCRTRLCWWCKSMQADGGITSSQFQCRTRLCWWCKTIYKALTPFADPFQCRTRLCWWCKGRRT